MRPWQIENWLILLPNGLRSESLAGIKKFVITLGILLIITKIFLGENHIRNPSLPPLIARFMGPTWGPSGADSWPHVGPMNLAIWVSNTEICYIVAWRNVW